MFEYLILLGALLIGIVAIAAALFVLGALGFILYYPLAAGWAGMKLFFHNRGWYNADAE
jgi:hypothetical protein